jgi:chemotaxis protein methyltransferase CheR
MKQSGGTHRLQASALAQQATDNPDLTVALTITKDQFNKIRSLADKHAGIHLADHKQNMVQRRVTRRVQDLGLHDIGSYCAFLDQPEGQGEIEFLINALTTNKTDFFRENHHFEHFAQHVLPDIVKRVRSGKQKRIRIWSAGCSSGQEAYTIAMTMLATVPDIHSLDAKILATDIDTDILARAALGRYDEHEIAQLPKTISATCFRADPTRPGMSLIEPAIKQLVSFRHLNLHDPWPMTGQFDVIFCRNVVIYFEKTTQIRLFDRFADILAPNGFVYIGHSESLFRVSDRFQFEGQSTYKKIR